MHTIRNQKYECFVITPFGKNDVEKETFDNVFRAITSVAPMIEEKFGAEVTFVRADENPYAFELINNIHKHIEQSHFCIVDLTGCNSNVFYEMGYAVSKEKDIILISQDCSPYPLDIAFRIVTKYSVDKDNLEELTHRLVGLVWNAIEYLQYKTYSIKDAYDVKCFQNRRAADLNKAFQNATKKVDILQTNLDIIEKEGYLKSLEEALEKNEQLKLRILTLDPDSYFTQKRAEQLGLAVSNYRSELEDSMNNIIRTFFKYIARGQFSLRIYDDFPTQITFVIDDFVYTCTVARNVRSRELCTFRLEKFAAGVERSFLFHFDAIWSNARVPPNSPIQM